VHSKLPQHSGMMPHEGSCVMCFSRPADHLCVPCGHQGGCHTCLQTLMFNDSHPSCPVCAKAFTSFQRVVAVAGYELDDAAVLR
jgi:hypothetical protein